MGERVLGMDEVRGSNPLTSTKLGLIISKGSLTRALFCYYGLVDVLGKEIHGRTI